MNILDRQNNIASAFENIHKNVLLEFKVYENNENIVNDKWEKEGLGNGHSVVIDDGSFFDKAGINFSKISGKKLPESSIGRTNESSGLPYFATGVSVVFHPKNPNIPTSHLNVRYFCTYKNDEVFEEWFGGGFDLTPYFFDHTDCVSWHKAAKKACDTLGEEKYKEFKRNCDEYFFLPHRKEHRGIGGIFYEKQEFQNIEAGIEFSDKVSSAYIEAYKNIVDKNKDKEYSDDDKKFQRFRRGRYVEFNLVYDRGTLFGLQSGGRIESILMSLPNAVEWHYKFDADLTKEQMMLYRVLKHPEDWIKNV
tara:strand:- start:6851 stop:7771 length:921 start_codon:yes stop_codon:yes gene_type:complete